MRGAFPSSLRPLPSPLLRLFWLFWGAKKGLFLGSPQKSLRQNEPTRSQTRPRRKLRRPRVDPLFWGPAQKTPLGPQAGRKKKSASHDFLQTHLERRDKIWHNAASEQARSKTFPAVDARPPITAKFPGVNFDRRTEAPTTPRHNFPSVRSPCSQALLGNTSRRAGTLLRVRRSGAESPLSCPLPLQGHVREKLRTSV